MSAGLNDLLNQLIVYYIAAGVVVAVGLLRSILGHALLTMFVWMASLRLAQIEKDHVRKWMDSWAYEFDQDLGQQPLSAVRLLRRVWTLAFFLPTLRKEAQNSTRVHANTLTLNMIQEQVEGEALDQPPPIAIRPRLFTIRSSELFGVPIVRRHRNGSRSEVSGPLPVPDPREVSNRSTESPQTP